MFNLPCVPGIPLIRSSHIWYCVLRMFHQFLQDKVHMSFVNLNLARNSSVLCESKRFSMKRAIVEVLFKAFALLEISPQF